MDLCIEESSSDVVFALWDRVALNIWRGKTTVAALRRGEHLMDQYFSRRGERLLLLTLIEATAPLPPLDARLELVAFLKRANDKVERSALVFEGEGFRAASIRAVVAGASLFSRPAYPHRVFNSVGGAARFLAGGKTGLPAPHLVIRMANEARRRPITSGFVPWVPGTAPLPGPLLRPR